MSICLWGPTEAKTQDIRHHPILKVMLVMKRVQTHTMTIHTEAKINLKMAHNWRDNLSPGGFGTALRSIFKMLRNAVPNSLGDRF